MTQLADKIAGAVNPTSPLTLDIRNISSLGARDVEAIRSALDLELQRHSFRLISSDSATQTPSVPLQVTLSESTDGYVWVVQILSHPSGAVSDPVMIVLAPKAHVMGNATREPYLSLTRRFIWKQPEKFLDFALLEDSSSSSPALLVLETNRLALYRSSGSQWQLSRTTPIPQTATRSRDPQGTIELTEQYVLVAGLKCVGDPDLAGNIKCGKVPPPPASVGIARPPGPGDSVGAVLRGACGDATASLATGQGDWTQADLVQGYLLKASHAGPPLIASGRALDFDGPVLSLEPEPDTSAARAVVQNLKTGAYEAYVVTATCSH